MHPILLTIAPFHLFGHLIGPLYLYSYGLCMATALGTSIYLFAKDAGRYIAPKINQSYDETFQKTFDLGVWIIICSIIGARIFYACENHDQFTGHWLDAFKIWQGGLVWYGGFFGGVAAAFLWMIREKWPMSYAYDLVAPYILLGHAIGRVGCFLNGCCYGNVSYKYGLVFPGAPDRLPHLPTQLYELVGDFALFLILLWARKWTIRFPWLTISLYALTYGTLRFFIEFLRRDWNKTYLIFFDSASQAVSAILIVIALLVIGLIYLEHRKGKMESSNP